MKAHFYKKIEKRYNQMSNAAGMVYADLINNVQFEAFYDKEHRILHVLDAMGIEPRMSVTNGIDNIIPILEKKLGIKHQYKIFLYGTDGIITEYDHIGKKFIIVYNDNPKVFAEFREKMKNLYQKGNEEWLMK